MAKMGQRPLSATEVRTAHTKQKLKPRFVSKAHREEQKDIDPLAFDDVRTVLARSTPPKKTAKG